MPAFWHLGGPPSDPGALGSIRRETLGSRLGFHPFLGGLGTNFDDFWRQDSCPVRDPRLRQYGRFIVIGCAVVLIQEPNSSQELIQDTKYNVKHAGTKRYEKTACNMQTQEPGFWLEESLRSLVATLLRGRRITSLFFRSESLS